MREAALFAAVGFLVLGASDISIDLIWLGFATWRRLFGSGAPRSVADLAPPRQTGAIALFVPCWDEAAVIGAMLRRALAALGEADYRIYVGCYPNDPGTIAAASAIADPRVRTVIGTVGIM